MVREYLRVKKSDGKSAMAALIKGLTIIVILKGWSEANNQRLNLQLQREKPVHLARYWVRGKGLLNTILYAKLLSALVYPHVNTNAPLSEN